MTAHKFEIKTQIHADPKTGEPTGVFRYRWSCSCGKVGPWKHGSKRSGQHAKAAHSASVGGERHVAAMERGRPAESASHLLPGERVDFRRIRR